MNKIEQLNFFADTTPALEEYGVIAGSILLAAELQDVKLSADTPPIMEEYKILTRQERDEQEKFERNLRFLDWKLNYRRVLRGEPDIAQLDPYEIFRADCNFRKLARGEAPESLRQKRNYVQATLEGIFDAIIEVDRVQTKDK